MDAVVFLSAALLSIAAAILVVTRRNPVYAAIWLICFFVLISVQFLVLRSPFIAVVQVFVYAGAIMVLFVFVIMLLNLTAEDLREKAPRRRKIAAGAVSLVLFCLLAGAIASSPTVRAPPEADLSNPDVPEAVADAGEIEAVGESMFSTHVLAFEFSSVLILVAIVGAIYLTKKRKPAPADEVGPAGAAEAQASKGGALDGQKGGAS